MNLLKYSFKSTDKLFDIMKFKTVSQPLRVTTLQAFKSAGYPPALITSIKNSIVAAHYIPASPLLVFLSNHEFSLEAQKEMLITLGVLNSTVGVKTFVETIAMKSMPCYWLYQRVHRLFPDFSSMKLSDRKSLLANWDRTLPAIFQWSLIAGGMLLGSYRNSESSAIHKKNADPYEQRLATLLAGNDTISGVSILVTEADNYLEYLKRIDENYVSYVVLTPGPLVTAKDNTHYEQLQKLKGLNNLVETWLHKENGPFYYLQQLLAEFKASSTSQQELTQDQLRMMKKVLAEVTEFDRKAYFQPLVSNYAYATFAIDHQAVKQQALSFLAKYLKSSLASFHAMNKEDQLYIDSVIEHTLNRALSDKLKLQAEQVFLDRLRKRRFAFSASIG